MQDEAVAMRESRSDAWPHSTLANLTAARPEVLEWSAAAVPHHVNTAFCHLVRQAGRSEPIHHWTIACLGSGLAAAILVGLATASRIMTALAFPVAVLIPIALLYVQAAQRRTQLQRQTIRLVESVARCVSAGMTVDAALQATADALESPVADELQHAATATALSGGRRRLMDSQLADTCRELALFAAIVDQHQQLGGDLSQSLQNLASRLRRLEQHSNKLRTATTSGRLVIGLMAVLPLLITAFYQWQDPTWMERVANSVLARLALMAGAALLITGLGWTVVLLRRLRSRMSGGAP